MSDISRRTFLKFLTTAAAATVVAPAMQVAEVLAPPTSLKRLFELTIEVDASGLYTLVCDGNRQMFAMGIARGGWGRCVTQPGHEFVGHTFEVVGPGSVKQVSMLYECDGVAYAQRNDGEVVRIDRCERGSLSDPPKSLPEDDYADADADYYE